MKSLLAPLLISTSMVAACVQTTDFEPSEDTSASDGATSLPATDTDATEGPDTDAVDTDTVDTDAVDTDAVDTDGSDTDGPLCGNGVLDPGEACDDDNQTNGDGCQADCTVTGGESLWTVEDVDLAEGRSVVALPDGGFVVGVGTSSRAGVLRFDADGQQVWAQTDSFEERYFGGLALAPDGDVLVVGTVPIEPDFGVGELWVGELSVADGSEQWTALPGISGSTWGTAIASDSAGALRVAGFSGGGGGSTALVAGLASDGTLQWSEAITELGSGYAEATDLVVLPDGSAVFVGTAEGNDGDPTLWVRRIDPAGAELWMTGYDGPELQNIDGSIERRSDGTLVVVASGYDEGHHTAVLELDESGSETSRHTWKRDDVLHQHALGSALASDGTLYVAGAHGDDVEFRRGGLYGAIDEQGTHLWSQIFSQGQPVHASVAHDVAVLSDGSVVFVGSVGSDDELPHLWMRKTGP